MPNSVTNFDGSITATPQQLVYPTTVEEIQAVMRDPAKYPSPVRAMGSYHSLTPCASSDGTIVNMTKMTQVIAIDETKMTLTAQAGLQIVDAEAALRSRKLQLHTNIEIGNMRLGSAATCHSKDGLDGIEFAQFNSYVISIKWVTPDGELAEANESDMELLRKVRTSYGLMGVVYEVTVRVKPLEALHLAYLPRAIDELEQPEVEGIIDSSEGLVCWTVGRTCFFQQRHKVDASPGLLGTLEGDIRRRLWSHTVAHVGQFIHRFFADPAVRNAVQRGDDAVTKTLYESLHLVGGITILAPDKTINYENSPPDARYAFTFWAFPRSAWVANMRAYLEFADDYFNKTGFRCNMPLGAYFMRADKNSLLSVTDGGDVFSIDPIHAVTDVTEWHEFLAAFNDFAYQRGGIPLLNQSPLVTRAQVEAAFGARWTEFSDWVREVDPKGRMLNPFFADLLSPAKA